MEQVEIEITGMAITARYGTLKSGTVLRTDRDYADHLVNDCGAAKYTGTAQASEAAPAPTSTAQASEAAPAPTGTAPVPEAALVHIEAAVKADSKSTKAKK